MSIADKLVTIAENEQKVYDSGYSQREKEMWDRLTNFKAKKDYTDFFREMDFTGEVFPKDITIIGSTSHMFYNYRGSELPSGLDFSNIEQYYLDYTAGETQTSSLMFSWATKLMKIYDVKFPAPKWYNGTFQYLRQCAIIEMPIKVREDTKFTNVFEGAYGIIDMRFEGVIGQNRLDVSPCISLSHDSLMSIINCLKDYSTDTSGTEWKVTLGSTNLAKLTDNEKLIATQKGWTLA